MKLNFGGQYETQHKKKYRANQIKRSIEIQEEDPSVSKAVALYGVPDLSTQRLFIESRSDDSCMVA
ncbi:hypothetical protein CU098_008959, partial [Rhizopus stolonifer]